MSIAQCGQQRPEIKRKSRLHIRKNDCGKGVIMAFPTEDAFHVIGHDELVSIVGENSNYLNTNSWKVRGGYGIRNPNRSIRKALEPYRIPTNR